MLYLKDDFKSDFFGKTDPFALIEKYGSPLYVYNEAILTQRCNEIKNLLSYPNFSVNYSPKANSNLELLKIIYSLGLNVDAMSPGEIFVNKKAGFTSDQIVFISNNVSGEEMKYAIREGVKISVDSLSQLELYGQINPGGDVVLRFNPGVGAGHHQKVVTAGKETKFAIDPVFIPEVKSILKKYRLKAVGINQHIGSLFLTSAPYLKASESLLEIASQFEDLDFVDFGGGFGIPYRETEKRLDLAELGKGMDEIIHKWTKQYGKEIQVKVEPGRYIVAESSVLLGSVFVSKMNSDIKYIGTDLGFNALVRPMMYDAYHGVDVFRRSSDRTEREEIVTVVGNICESGDIIAKDRKLPVIFENDLLGIRDAGAYGYSMSSSYNLRLRPAEVLLKKDQSVKLIRRRETLDDMLALFV